MLQFPVWRIVLEKIATLQEIETHWSYDDLMRANALLDMKNDITKLVEAKSK